MGSWKEGKVATVILIYGMDHIPDEDKMVCRCWFCRRFVWQKKAYILGVIPKAHASCLLKVCEDD